MDEKDIQRSLEAIKSSGEKVLSSREESIRFLKEIGIMGDDDHLKPQFKDNVQPVHDTPQSRPGVSRLRP